MGSESDIASPVKVGAYRVEERLGRGGMGEVYRGFDERLQRPVALKHVLKDQVKAALALERLRREARAIARLNHPAIVQIYDWVEAEDGCWYVMELVEGRTLKAEIRSVPDY
ncbi:MAG: protein kinase [bacterium]|nr:protein kinase [bacterium]